MLLYKINIVMEVKAVNKKVLLVIASMLMLILAACGDKDNQVDEAPEIIDVQLHVNETADVNEKLVLKATVTQGDEKVKDADEVMFEVWEDGNKDDSEMIVATNNEDGSYEAEKAFEHDGVYIVQVHVTARNMHSMPKTTVVVGDATLEDHHNAEDEEEEHDHSGH